MPRATGKRKRDRVIRVVRGNVTVRINKVHHYLRGFYYQVNDYSSGRRVRKSFVDFGEAKRHARQVAEEIAQGRLDASRMRPEDKASWVRATDLLRKSGVPLELAAAQFAEAFEILDGNRVVEAAHHFKESKPKALPEITVAAVVAELLKTRKNAKRSKRHLEDLKSRLDRFAAAFHVQISTVTGPLLQSWLDGIEGSEQTRKNFRTALSNLFRFALRRGYVRQNPVEGTEKPKVKAPKPNPYTPAEGARLLAAAGSDILPAMALSAFAGFRTAEVWRLEWVDVKLGDGRIEIDAGKTKGGFRRWVPITPNLAEWIAPHAKTEGLIWKGTAKAFYAAAHRAAESARIPWKENGLRDSFASYRLAVVKNAGQVALEMGNSAKMVQKHYAELVTEADGNRWFTIRPQAAENVVPMVREKTG